MTWRAPELLWLLLAVAMVAALQLHAWRQRRRATLRLGQMARVQALVTPSDASSGSGRLWRGVVTLLGLASLVIALAGPRFGSHTRTLRKSGIDLVIAIDCSKSMLARDVRPDRIGRAKAELMGFLQELSGDRVGVVAFAGDTMEFPLTYDYGAVSLFLRDLHPNDMPVGGTAISRALVASKRLLERSRPRQDANRDVSQAGSQRSQAVILLTDGEDHEGDPVEAARELAAAGIRVYTVGIGSRTGEPVPTYSDDGTWTGYLRDADGKAVTTSLSDKSAATLKEVADLTHGRFIRAAKGSVGMEGIRRAIRRLKQSEEKSRQVTVHEERYLWPTLIAGLLMLLETLIPGGPLGWRRRRTTRPEASR